MNNKYPMYLKLIKEIFVFVYGSTISIFIVMMIFTVAILINLKLDKCKTV